MPCADIRTEMAEKELCLLSWALNHIGHVNNTSVPTVNGRVNLYCAQTSR